MILPGMVVVFIIILVVLYLTRYPIPPMLLWVIYAIIIVLLILIVLQALGILSPLPAMRITPRQNFSNQDATDEVTLTLTNIERLRDITRCFALQEYGIHAALDPGDTRTFTFMADKPGVYWFYCTWFCSALHMEMRGRLIVEPKT